MNRVLSRFLSNTRWVGFAAIAALATVSSSIAATEGSIDPEVLSLREAAWRAWFAGDEPALMEMLPPEFIGINMQDSPFASRERSAEQAKGFKAGGGRLVSLEFPETRAQVYGDVVVLYGRYAVVFEPGGGAPPQTVAGRLTELFVKRGGHWLHTGWHLDTASSAP
jgi:hypothetical protein